MKKSILSIAVATSLMTSTAFAASVQHAPASVTEAQRNVQIAQAEYHQWHTAFNNAPASEREYAATKLDEATNKYQTAVLAEKVAIKQWLTPALTPAQAAAAPIATPSKLIEQGIPQPKQLTPEAPVVPSKVAAYVAPVATPTHLIEQQTPVKSASLVTPPAYKEPAPLAMHATPAITPTHLIEQAEPTKMRHPDFVQPHVAPQIKQETPVAQAALVTPPAYKEPAPLAGHTAPSLTPTHLLTQAEPSKAIHPDFVPPHAAPQIKQLTPAAPASLVTPPKLAVPAPVAAYATPSVTPTHIVEQAEPTKMLHPDFVQPHVAPQIKQLTPVAVVTPPSYKEPAPVAAYATPSVTPTHIAENVAPTKMLHPDFVQPHAAPQIQQLTPTAKAPVIAPPAYSAPAPVAAYATPSVTPTHLIAQAEPKPMAHPDFVAPHQIPQVKQLTPAAPATTAALVTPPAYHEPAPLPVYATPSLTPVKTAAYVAPAAPVVPATPAAPAAPIAAPTVYAPQAVPTAAPSTPAPAPVVHYKEPQNVDVKAAYVAPSVLPKFQNEVRGQSAENVVLTTSHVQAATVTIAQEAPVSAAPAALATAGATTTTTQASAPSTLSPTSQNVASALQNVGAANQRVQAAQNNLAQAAAKNPNPLQPSQAQQNAGGNLVNAQNNLKAAQSQLASATSVAVAAKQASVAAQTPPAPAAAPATTPATPATPAATAPAAKSAPAAAPTAASTPAAAPAAAAPAAAAAAPVVTGPTNAQFEDLKRQVGENRHRASAGIAGVAAMANIPQVTNTQNFSVGAGVGTTDGESALAVGFSARATENVVIKGSVSNDTQHNFVVGAGMSYGW